jgi:hypothetical protein
VPLQAEIVALRRRSTELGAIEGKLSFRALMAAIRTLDRFPRLKAALRAVIVFPSKLVARFRSKEP